MLPAQYKAVSVPFNLLGNFHVDKDDVICDLQPFCCAVPYCTALYDFFGLYYCHVLFFYSSFSYIAKFFN